MNIKNIKKFGLILIVYLLTGCSSDDTMSPYPILDSEMTASRHLPDIAWLDNNKVLFVGKKHITSPEPHAMYIWSLDNNRIEHYKDYANNICYQYQHNTIFYSVINPETHKKVFYQGKFGNEEIIEDEFSYIDKVNCQTFKDYPGSEQDRTWKPLLHEHGYIDYGKHKLYLDNQASAIFYPAGDREPIKLPFNHHDVYLHIAIYSPFKNAYFLYRDYDSIYIKDYQKYRDFQRIPPLTVWWLYPDGKTERIDIPPGEWLLGSGFMLRPTRTGILLIYHGGMKSQTDPGYQGAYFIQGNNIKKVLNGYIIGPSVSPDGCRVALSHAPNNYHDKNNEYNRRTLKVINFCDKEEIEDD